jgi:hypothetical protein
MGEGFAKLKLNEPQARQPWLLREAQSMDEATHKAGRNKHFSYLENGCSRDFVRACASI